MLVLDGERVALRREVDPERPHHRHAGALRAVEERVPVGQQGVAVADGRAHVERVVGGQQPRLAAARVEVRVGAEERLVGGGLDETEGRADGVTDGRTDRLVGGRLDETEGRADGVTDGQTGW